MKFWTRSTCIRTPVIRSMIDTLEPRSLLSASPTATNHPAVATHAVQFQTFAVKASVISLRISSSSSTPGQAISLSAFVAGARSTGVPSGTVTFFAGKASVGSATLNSQGVAKLSTTVLPEGVLAITAVYSGSSRFLASTSTGVTHTVARPATTTKLSVTSSTSTLIGNATTLLAKVGAAAGGAVPTGRVAFYDGSTVLASKNLNSAGAARLTANYLFVGTHNLKAVYLGSASYLGHRSTAKAVTVSLPALSTASDGLRVGVITPGPGGLSAATGDEVFLEYTLYLANGTKLESSIGSTPPFHFTLGVHHVIPGFDEGLQNVQAGEKRVLIIPPALAYGSTGSPGVPPNSTIVFVVNVLSITPAV